MSEYTGGAAAAGISAGLGKAAEKIEKRDVAKEMAEFEMDLQIQKAKTLAQVKEQFDIEAEVRARANELWKMEEASRLDFANEEKRRQQEYDEFLSTEKFIDDKVASGEWDEKRAEGPRFENAYKHEKLGKPEISARLGSSPEYVQRIKTGKAPGAGSIIEGLLNKTGPEYTPPPPKTPPIWVYSPNGKLAQVPADQIEEAITEGAKLAPGQVLPKSPAFQEAGTQWLVEQELLKRGKLDKEAVFEALDNAWNVAQSTAGDPKDPFASLRAQSEIADIRNKYPEFFREYMRTVRKQPYGAGGSF